LRAPFERPVGLVATAFFTLGAALVFAIPGADDEGYLTFIGARVMLDEPLAGFFFQKIHPVLSAFYAPIAALGWPAFRIAHVLVAALGIWLLGDAVERLGGSGVLGALVLALSPAFLLAAVAGQSNTDGVAFFAAVLNLHARGGRAALAGAALAGVAVWTRYELALLLGAVVLWGSIDRKERWARLAAACAFPILYVLSGALYHGDLGWIARFTPSITAPVPSNPIYEWLALDEDGLTTWIWHVTLAVPAWPVLIAVRWKTLNSAGRVLSVALAAQALAMLVLPLLRMFFEGLGPRYMLVLTPAVAVVLSLAPLRVPKWSPRIAVALGAALVLATPFLPGDVLRRLGIKGGELTALADELGSTNAGTIYTDSASLAALLRWSSDRRVRFLPHHDVLFELHHLANHDNGQYPKIIGALARHLYGGAAWPCGIDDLTSDDRFVTFGDHRLELLYPDGYWNAYTERLEGRHGATVRRPKPNVTRLPVPRPPPNVPAEVFWSPCGERPRAEPDLVAYEPNPAPVRREEERVPTEWNGIHVGDALGDFVVASFDLHHDEPRIWVASGDRYVAISVVERGARSEAVPVRSRDYDLYYGALSGADRRPTGGALAGEEIEPVLRALAERLDR
jgi:hypothetical protein